MAESPLQATRSLTSLFAEALSKLDIDVHAVSVTTENAQIELASFGRSVDEERKLRWETESFNSQERRDRIGLIYDAEQRLAQKTLALARNVRGGTNALETTNKAGPDQLIQLAIKESLNRYFLPCAQRKSLENVQVSFNDT